MSDLTTTFTNIANAIRSKTGSSDTMTPSEMPDEIAGIETPMDSINITQNGTYEPSEGRGYNQVIVNVPEPTLITKSITANGTYTASDDNADGYSSVTVAVEGFKKKSIANTPTDIASFNDGTANPMPSLEISIEPVQSGSGDPSPSNVRPISGWSGAKIADDAEYGGFINWNQLINPNNYATGTYSQVVVTKSGNNLLANGTANGNAYIRVITSGNNLKTVSGHKYFVNIPSNADISYYDDSTNRQYYNKTSPFMFEGLGEYTLSAFCRINSGVTVTNALIWMQIIDLTQAFGTTTADYIYQLEQTTAGAGVAYFRNLFPHDYYPYNAGEITTVSAVNGDVDKYSIIPIPFHDSSDNPITVYGGRLNVTSGELRVDRAMVDLGTLPWASTTSGVGRFYASIANLNPKTVSNGTVANIVCEAFPTQSATYVYGNEGYIALDSGANIWVSATTLYSSIAEFKTAMNGVKLVYELATPQTYQLTPTQVTTLLNQNNIFADCGQILEGEYFVTL